MSKRKRAVTVKKSAKASQNYNEDLEPRICVVEPLWADKFRPRSFEQLTFHEEINERLCDMVESKHARASLPHLIFYGPNGSGKRTRVQCLLQRLYRLTPEEIQAYRFGGSDSRVHRLGKPDILSALSSDGTVSGIEEMTRPQRLVLNLSNVGPSGIQEIFVLRSPFHLELTPSDLNHRDLQVVQQALKAFVQSGEQSMYTYMRQKNQQNNDVASKKRALTAMFGASSSAIANDNDDQTKETLSDHADDDEIGQKGNPEYRVVVINKADRLSHAAQAALRRTMEVYSRYVRFILIAESIDGIIDPIQSRALPFRVPLVTGVRGSEGLVENTLRYALRDAHRSQIDSKRVRQFLTRINKSADGDLTRAFLLLQCSIANLPEHKAKNIQHVSPTRDLLEPDWIETVVKIVDVIAGRDVRAEHMNTARSLMRDLQTHCIPPRSVVWTLYCTLVQRLADEKASQEDEDVSPVCADIAWLCAEYERRAVGSHFYVVHLDALLAKLLLCVGLYRRGQKRTQDASTLNASFRAYDTVDIEARRMPNAQSAAKFQIFHKEKQETQSSDVACDDNNTSLKSVWAEIWQITDVKDIDTLKSLCVQQNPSQ